MAIMCFLLSFIIELFFNVDFDDDNWKERNFEWKKKLLNYTLMAKR